MSTMTPNELLNLWQQEQMTIEMSIGHILQNLVKQQSLLESLLVTQSKLRADVNSLSVTVDAKSAVASKPKLR